MQYKGKGGIQYNLEQSPFAQGGEGKVFNIIGKPNMVAKLYKNGLNDTAKERKLLVMVNNPPSQAVMSQIAWPLDVLYDSSNAFVGFVMPKLAINEDLNVIYEYGSSSKYPNVPWSNKIIIAKNLCAVLDAVHEVGHVVGDLNPKNISVDPQTGHIVFVDTDSYHIEDNGNVYRCNVGMPEYLPVEIQKKMKGGLTSAALPTFTQATDNFALAIHIFQLLMNGTHPFSCRVLPSQASVAFPQPSDNILNGDFPFVNPKSGTSIPVFAPPISILPKEMQELFKRAFVVGHTNPKQRPTPEEWYNALSSLEKQLKKCGSVSHHEYYSGLNQCPWCTADHNFTQGVTTAKKTQMTQSTISKGMTPAYVAAPKYTPPSTSRNSTYTSTTPSSRTATYAGTYTGGYTHSTYRSKKKWLIPVIIAILVAVAIIVGVSISKNSGDPGEKIINLTAPESVSVNNGVLSWSNVSHASAYTIKINGEEVPVSTNSFSLDDTYSAGTYRISVMARGSTSNIVASSYSNEITITKPVAVDSITLTDNILSWNPVNGYEKYKITANGVVIDTVNGSSYSLVSNANKIGAGSVQMGVIVSGNSQSVIDSDPSNAVSFNKLNSPLNISVIDDTLSWQKVSNATSYIVSITHNSDKQTIELDSSVNSYYLLGKLPKGEYSITIQAKGNGKTIISSNESNSCSYKVTDTIIYLATKQDLVNIGNDLNAKYIMQNDINISGEEWTPIGSVANRFNGALIGNGYSIIGLTLTSKDTKGAGFFGVVGENGKISDVCFSEVNISGGTTGYVGTVAGVNYGTIFDVTVQGTVGTSNNGDNVGGLVGRSFGSMYNCTNEATVKGGTNVGGIAGNFEFNSANMAFNNCTNKGVVSGKTKVGGLVGYLRVSRLVYISKLTNTASVSATSNYAGGIAGYTEGVSGQTGNYDSCLNTGSINGYEYVGGCFGYVGNYINITTSNPSDVTKECNSTGSTTASSGNHAGKIQGN